MLAAAVGLLALAGPARAQSGLGGLGLGGLPGLLLGPNPANSSRTVSPGFDDCPAGGATCPARVILEMYERWRPLNARCDHRAVFALTYLRTTEAFARAIAADKNFFEDGPWVNHEDAIFAQLYFRAYDARVAKREVPVSWRIAFDAATSPDVTGIGDMFLGMNAHINRDLSYTLAAVGLVKPGGGSRKTDHDKVNTFLANVADPLQDELGRRYDPLFGTTDTPSPLDEGAVLEAVRGFREQAWRNAEPLVNAPDDGSRAMAASSIEAQSELYANSILAAGTMPGYGPTRDAYCRANLRPSFKVKVIDRGLKRPLRKGRLRLRVHTDGPARVELAASLLRKRGSAAAKRGRLRLTRVRQLKVTDSGNHRTKLKLTKRGRRVLSGRRGARLLVRLKAPGLDAEGRRKLRRR
jgi:hypothetical protein